MIFLLQLEIEIAKPSDLPFPPPLDEGVSQEMFDSYIATPPPTPPPEVCNSEYCVFKKQLIIDTISRLTNIYWFL